jgi:alcohol oxidase
LKISFAKAGLNVPNDFLAVGSAYDEERGPIDDLNALYACNGYGVSHFQPLQKRYF